MYHANNSGFKLAGVSFAVIMTLAVEGSMLWRFDAMAQDGMQGWSPAQITLPTVFVRGR